jgi:N utilization substance protein A
MQTGYESLVQLPGIGINVADALFEKGFLSVEDLASAGVEDLTSIRGIGEEKAAKLIDSAKLAMQTGDREPQTETESVSLDESMSDVSEPGNASVETSKSEIDIPDVNTPEIDTPEIDTPEIDTPEIDTIDTSKQVPPVVIEKTEPDENLDEKPIVDDSEGEGQENE